MQRPGQTSAPSVRAVRHAIRFALVASAGSAFVTSPSYGDAGTEPASLEEVVVTATRREQSILDIPYSISAVSSEALEDNHVQNLADLSHLVAGLSFVDQGPTSRSNFVLR